MNNIIVLELLRNHIFNSRPGASKKFKKFGTDIICKHAFSVHFTIPYVYIIS